ncbi:hypothetical protein EVAR_67062_1 [Eumeta japonica]|uniref:Uncharacterized protein n=1 Tax=Eumeta variegata TaxID=151549 RepID=A0A4C1ZEI1_EUMVA|nr:hypothetical protein EVAR_67062_1 [Eumeta japonica]
MESSYLQSRLETSKKHCYALRHVVTVPPPRLNCADCIVNCGISRSWRDEGACAGGARGGRHEGGKDSITFARIQYTCRIFTRYVDK